MIEESKIKAVAALTKVSLVKRAADICEKYTILARYRSGFNTEMSEERIDTITGEIEFQESKQKEEIVVLAVLRYCLGITEDIEPKNLDLHK